MAITLPHLAAADVQALDPFEMMTPAGFLGDGGLIYCLAIAGRALSRLVYLRKMAWLMPRVNRAVPYLGDIVVAGTRPA
jgi:hypothetical protein